MKTFLVYKYVKGEWVFWFNARGKSCKQLHQAVWWKNKGKVSKDNIKVEEPELSGTR